MTTVPYAVAALLVGAVCAVLAVGVGLAIVLPVVWCIDRLLSVRTVEYTFGALIAGVVLFALHGFGSSN